MDFGEHVHIGSDFVETDKLKALCAAIDLGSLTSAAEELQYTQSGLTHMMNALEKEMGITLLRRSRSGVRLTHAGERLMPFIRRVLQSAEELESELNQLKGNAATTLRVGAYSSIAQHWLPLIVQNFRQVCPTVDVRINMAELGALYDMVDTGDIDLAFASRQSQRQSGQSWIPLRNDELVAVLPADYPNNGILFNIHDFEDREFLMPSAGFDLDILPALGTNNVHPIIRRTNLDDSAIVSMVEYGQGLSILSELVMQGRKNKVLALPLTPPAYRELGITLRTEKLTDRLVKRFLACATETVMGIYKN